MQSAQRHHCNGSIELRLSKQETQHRDRQINIGYAENSGSIARHDLRQHFHDLYRLILASLRVKRSLRNWHSGQPLDRQREPFGRCALDPVQRISRHVPNRHQAKVVHTLCTCTSLDSAAGVLDFSGSVTVNVVPWLRWLTTSTSPSWALTIP